MTPQPEVQGKHVDRVAVRDPIGTGRRSETGRGALLPGKVVAGRYRVLDTLGAGSLGTVYLCEELATGRKAALKIFRRDVSRDEEFLRRLRWQVKLAATLGANTPSVVTAYECGQTEDGSAFLTTEYLQGRTLRDVIRRGGSLDVQRALRLACQIAEGLDAIHGAGYVHGDIRPENVIVIPARNEEVAKLKGFEVAGLRDTAVVDHLIRAGVISPNAEYVAPERVEGDRATVRSDIYAFGILLYEMLTGRVPFVGTSPDDVMAKQLQDAPAALSVCRRGIPSVLEVRVKQALEKEPERRQRYVGDVANEYLCELSSLEMLAERAQQKRGMIGKVATTVGVHRARPAGTPAEGGPLTMGGTIGVIVALVVLAAAAAVWLYSPLWSSLRASLPWPPQRAAVGAGPPIEKAVPPQEAVTGAVTPSVPLRETLPPGADAPEESSLRAPGARERLSPVPRRVDRSDPSPRSARKAPAERGAPLPPNAQPETPTRTREAPDPTAIIDWLLGQPSGRE